MIDADSENRLILNNLGKKYQVVEFYQIGVLRRAFEWLSRWDIKLSKL